MPSLRAVVTALDLRILIGLATVGAGWTVLPDYLCAGALVSGALAQLATAKPGLENSLFLVWKKTALRYPRVVHVRDYLLNASKGF